MGELTPGEKAEPITCPRCGRIQISKWNALSEWMGVGPCGRGEHWNDGRCEETELAKLRAENARLSEEVARLKAERDESARYACEQLLDMYWLYPNYRVDTRGPVGKIRNVTSRLWPVLDEVIGNAGFDEARKAFFPTDENVEPLPESPK